MTVFLSTLNQMGFLVLLIAIGYILGKVGAVPDNAARVLSKLENNVFVPALVIGTFMSNFTVSKITSYRDLLLCGLVVMTIMAFVGSGLAKLFSKDAYIRKIYTYGLAFANFGFMGNAVVEALFPDIFLEYLIFVIPFWIFIYVWGVPKLLIPSDDKSSSFFSKIKPFINPMFIGMIIGMILGLTSLPLPDFISKSVDSLGDCMSPLAMLLTGITVAKIDLKKTFQKISIYLLSLVRLIAIPAITILALYFIDLPKTIEICIVCGLSMPLGLNTIVVPGAYGLDTSEASGMALISHLMSCLTIPVVFMAAELWIF